MKNIVAIALTVLVTLPAQPALSQSRPSNMIDYELVRDIEVGTPGFWDYLTFDPSSKRIYASHVDKVSVIDATTGKTVGEVGPLADSHGIAIVPELGKGYADSGDDAVLKVFSLKDFHIIKELKVSADSDGVIYDPYSRRILIVAGDSKDLTIVDPATDEIIKRVALPGKPEFLAADGHGTAFVNLSDTSAIAKVDIATGTVTASFPLENCEAPHGLAFDDRTNRLFSGCEGRLVVVDPASGKNLANLPIGPRSDGIVVDSARGRVFSSSAFGTLTVISEAGGEYAVGRTIPTFFGGRNLAIDPTTGNLFISHGNMAIAGPAKPLDLRFRWDGLDIAMFAPND